MLTREQQEAGIKAARQDMNTVKENGIMAIVNTKMGIVELDYEDGLYRLLKDGAIVFQAYEHTLSIFINNMVTRVYCYD